jgi:hypothetical protein
MSDAELWAAWRLWMAVGAAIVLVAAGLLVTIWLTARQILAEAHRALAAAERIQRRTDAIWALDAANDVTQRIHDTVEEIAGKGAALAEALQGKPVDRRTRM